MDADLTIWDCTDPASPVRRGTAIGGGGGSLLGRHEDRLFMRKGTGAFYSVEVSDLDAPYVVRDNFLQVYDVLSDPSGPVAVSPAFTDELNIYNVLGHGNHVYADGMRAYDLSNPSSPQYLGRGLDEGWSRFVHENRIVSATGSFPIQCAPSAVPEEGGLPAEVADLGLRVAPNPFNPQTRIRFELPESAAVRLSLYDAAGRRVRTCLDDHLTAGPHVVWWDGRDDRGRSLGSGVFFARLEAESAVVTCKMILLR
jgi:hypothetical protein